MSFLPEGYKEPVTNNYMKLLPGENTFRVLSDAIVGRKYWKTSVVDGKEVRKPLRLHMDKKFTPDALEVDEDGQAIMPKVFWAFVVYNRTAELVQILELTQRTVRDALTALDKSKAWGDIKGYDITVTREGEKFDTTYTVIPNPKEEIDEGIVKLYEDMKINLNALYKGDDPFKSEVDTDQIAEDADEAIIKSTFVK